MSYLRICDAKHKCEIREGIISNFEVYGVEPGEYNVELDIFLENIIPDNCIKHSDKIHYVTNALIACRLNKKQIKKKLIKLFVQGKENQSVSKDVKTYINFLLKTYNDVIALLSFDVGKFNYKDFHSQVPFTKKECIMLMYFQLYNIDCIDMAQAIFQYCRLDEINELVSYAQLLWKKNFFDWIICNFDNADVIHRIKIAIAHNEKIRKNREHFFFLSKL